MGDLDAIQGGILGFQGQREVALSQQGNIRQQVFQLEVRGAPIEEVPSDYAPAATYESVIKGVAECRFAVAFTEPPMLKSHVTLKWRDTNHKPSQDWDTRFGPVITACVMNWKRLKEHWMFLGADVSFHVYDHPFDCKMICRFEFWGPAVSTPFTSSVDCDNTNPKV